MGTATFDFSGEVVLVTGGSRGLGLEIAQAFGGAGATVVITARREQWLNEAEQLLKGQGVTVHSMICDVADHASVEQAVQRTIDACGKINVLVNNAGLTWGAPAESMPLDRWHQVMEANVSGTFLMSQAVGRHMLEAGKGAIVNIASIAGLSGGQLNTVGYNTSKAAVINMTRALAVEWSQRGVRVNAIAPGMFRTRMTEAILQRAEPVVAQNTPMKRIGQPGELGPAVLFLASDAASYITGQVLAVDGGRSAG
ncbi:MAG TPA: glucose 1-dehydrogenase [Ktedonosporobacter sp.]|jgi:gluconate 5-dehydrogenase|nr:glucose 1-dehydrogenase [Ktedonosporobacter sp.]